jgi:cytochrome P450
MLWRDPIGFYTALAAGAEGDVAHTKVGWRDFFLLTHPDLVRELMEAKAGSFSKGYSLTRTKLLLGEGLLTSEGEFHDKQRKLIRPAFHHQRLAGYGETMARFAVETAGRWRDGEERDISVDMMRLSQRIVAKSLFQTDIENEETKQADEALDAVIAGFNLLMIPGVHRLASAQFTPLRRFKRARETLAGMVQRMIEERRQHGDKGDVLSMLLAAESEEGGRGMDDAQIRDEAMTIFLAGHDTLGNALGWTWYLLSQHPEVEAKWHAELKEGLAGRAPGAGDLGSLRYTRQLLTESMRLYPPVWAVGRQAREATEIGGRAIPKGSIVQTSQWLMHRDERFFPEPERFLPERWTGEFYRNLPKGAYFPFGVGERLCLGMRFAWMAGIIVLATQGQEWRMRLVPGHLVETEPRITLRPKYGLKMKLESRK